MAALYQAIGNQSAGAASVAVAWPAHVTDDLGILIIETGGEGTTLAVPSGWTAVTGSPVTAVASTAGSKLQVWYKFATSNAEANVNTGDSGDHQVARIITFRGVDKTTPFDATTVTDIKTTASTTVTWPAITTATSNALVVLIATRPNDSTSTTAFSNPVNSNLTSLTERGEAGSNAGHGGGFVVVTGTKDAAGSTGTTTMTGPSVTNAEMVIALRPLISSGSLSVSETGSDTFSASGSVVSTGSLSATETGSDTFSASGQVTAGAISGSLAATETGTDTFTASGDVIVQGSLSATETGNDTFAASGTVLIEGNADVTETGSDTFAATGSLTAVSSGSLAATETGDDTFSSSGKVVIQGTWTITELGDDAFDATGQVLISGSLSGLETGDDSFSSAGTTIGGVVGSFSATEAGNDVLGGYVEDGYVNGGYVNPGISGYLGRIGVLNATESTGVGGDLPYVLKFYNGTTWQILYKDPTVYT